MLPFFDDYLDVDIGLSLNGEFTVNLIMSEKEYTKPGILSIVVNSLGFKVVDGQAVVILSGLITPMFEKEKRDWPIL